MKLHVNVNGLSAIYCRVEILAQVAEFAFDNIEFGLINDGSTAPTSEKGKSWKGKS